MATQWDRMTVACFGIGVLPPTAGMIAYIGDAYTPRLISKGAVGDVCAHPFNQQGKILETPLPHCMIGVGVKQLQRTPCRIAVATDIKKARAVTGALRTGLITHLFVDSHLASAVMAGSGADEPS